MRNAFSVLYRFVLGLVLLGLVGAGAVLAVGDPWNWIENSKITLLVLTTLVLGLLVADPGGFLKGHRLSLFALVLFSPVLLLIGATLSLRLPAVQTRVVSVLADSVSARLGMRVAIGHVAYTWFDELSLQNVRIDDAQRRPMIAVGQLDVNFKLKQLIDSASTNINLDGVRLVRPEVSLVVNPRTGDLNIDEFIAKIDSLTAPKTPSKNPSSGPLFTIDQATVEAGTFRYDDPREPVLGRKGTFDYYHFAVHDLAAETSDFLLLADTVALQIDNLRGVDRVAGLRIHELDTKFFFSNQQMRFDGLLAHINKSVIRRQVVFRYHHRRDLGNFNEKVRILAHLDSTVVYSEDLSRFSRPLYAYKDVWKASGDFDGLVGQFRMTKANLYFGKKSEAHGTIAFKGLPEFETSTMDFDLHRSHVEVADLAQYVGPATAEAIERFGPVDFDAKFLGRYDDFHTQGVFQTALGRAEPDLTMKLAANSAQSTYTGQLKLDRFSLGDLIQDKALLQTVDLAGHVEGRGLSLDNAVLNFDGYVARLGIRGYDYRQAYVNGQLQKGLFDGQVTLKDTNLVFNLAGRADLRNHRNAFDLTGKLERANLLPLGFADQNIQLHSELAVNFVGLNPDSLYGTAQLLNTYLTLEKRSLVVDSLFINATRPVLRVDTLAGETAPQRRVEVRSNLLDATVAGPFRFSQVAADLPRLIEEYTIYFRENEAERTVYYARRASQVLPRYTIEYEAFLKNTNPLLAFFLPEGYISPNARLSGQLRLGNTSVFTLNAQADTVKVAEYQFYGSEIDLNTSKLANQPDVLASVIVTSKAQKMASLAKTEALEVEGSWEQDRIGFTASLRQTDSPNRANLNGTIQFTPEGTELRFRRSGVHLVDGDWTMNPGNLISLTGSTIQFKDVVFKNIEQSLSADGTISVDSTQSLQLKAQDFRLESLAQLVNLEVKGTLNASVTARDVYKNLRLEGNASVDELVYHNFLLGNLLGEARWDLQRQQVNVNAAIDRMNNRIVTVKGTFDPSQKENSLNLLATLSQTNLELVEPFTQGLFSNLSGTASGQVRIQGTPIRPQFNGDVDIRRGRLRFDYLRSVLRFEDKIYFDGNDITARRLRLTDDEGNTGTLSGGVYSGGSGNYALNLKIGLNSFKVMNTTAPDNDMFYGTAYVTTTPGRELEIFGPFDNLSIKATATTNRNTKIYIPFDNATTVSSEEFMTLLSDRIKADSVARHAGDAVFASLKRRDNSRIQMEFDFDITPDAVCEIQLNRQTGEGLTATGTGRLKLGIDTQGDFTMSGTYTIQQGRYAFKYQNYIDKPFEIRAGSRISWGGDPYEANIDIRAAYRQLVSLSSIMPSLTDAERKDPQYQRRYPVSVVLSLNDRLLAPKISYQLEIQDYPKIGPFVRDIPAFEASLQSNEQELSRQVSSVLAFGQLIPANSTQAFGQVNVLNNLTELAANQISSWLSQINPNLQVNYLSLNGASTTASQALIGDPRASISYNFRDRLRITRDGGFTSSAYIGNANLIGDWSMEVLLTKDGRWRGKAFNRFVQNPFQQSINTQTVANFGASLLYTQSFNYFFRPRTQPRATPTLIPTLVPSAGESINPVPSEPTSQRYPN